MSGIPQAVTAEEALKDISDTLKIIVQALKRQPSFNAPEFDRIISDSVRDQNERVRSLLKQLLN